MKESRYGDIDTDEEMAYIYFDNFENFLEFLDDFRETKYFQKDLVEIVAFPKRRLVIFLFNGDLKEDWLFFMHDFLFK